MFWIFLFWWKDFEMVFEFLVMFVVSLVDKILDFWTVFVEVV